MLIPTAMSTGVLFALTWDNVTSGRHMLSLPGKRALIS